MTIALHGLGVSRGIAIGRAHVLARGTPVLEEQRLSDEDIEQEVLRYTSALGAACAQLIQVRGQIPPATPLDITALIETHLLMLEDAAFAEVPVDIIRFRKCNAEWALKLQRDALVRVFNQMDDAYLRTRQDDIDYVVNTIYRFLQEGVGVTGTRAPLEGAVIIATDLSPADTLMLQHRGICAFVTEHGGANSHTAILARSLGIPALVGAHGACNYVKSGESVVVDGWHGVLFAGAGAIELDYFLARQREEEQDALTLRDLVGQPAITRDGQPVRMMANVELSEDLLSLARVGAEGIGLFRTEILFMNRDTAPSEEEQFDLYRHALQSVGGAPVTIRTLDIGVDKLLPWAEGNSVLTMNPALSLRGIRWCLREVGVFKTQLRAILRASAYGRVRLMLPMLTNVQEVLLVKQLVAEVQAELRRERLSFDSCLAVGGMIEVPAAALIADVLARHLDFLSIGTNDLIQYTVAADRVDDSVGQIYDPLHPAVLRLIRITIEAGRKAGIPVSMCGEMAGDMRYTHLLLGLGLREFSMHPAFLLEVKRLVNATDAACLTQRVDAVLAEGDDAGIRTLLDNLRAECSPTPGQEPSCTAVAGQ